MNTRFYSLAAQGLYAELIKIEVDHYRSNPGTVIVGLGDLAVQESKERVRAAIKNSGFSFPRGRVVVNLAPADIKKSGPCFDLAIALGLISLRHKFIIHDVEDSLFFGELSLDGKLRHINGMIALVTIAKEKGFKKVFVPKVDVDEASLIPGLDVFGVESLVEIVSFLRGEIDLEKAQVKNVKSYFSKKNEYLVDLSEVRGQLHAKRALEIAAAGSHNIIFSGAPGSGKTMMAKALQGILPRMTLSETLEVTRLYSLSGLLSENDFLITQRPFRTVHHTASGAAIVGGGRVPKPGEISLAHRGVLFLDEMPEFPSHVLELLRQPIEDKQITISRTQGSLTYPAQFILCGAMNPCPCGYYQVLKSKKICECTPAIIHRYKHKLSGPLIDRIDLFCPVSPLEYKDFDKKQEIESSETVLGRVQKARDFQHKRYKKSYITVNSEMSVKDIQKYCSMTPAISSILEKAMDSLNLSARGYHRVLKVARTIADLELRGEIGERDVLEALQYRRTDH